MTAAAGAAALAATPAAAATVLDVNWNSGCGAANCFNDDGVYTKTWSAAGAHGPMTIGQFLLDHGILGDLDGKTFRISFSIGGEEVGTWGSYNMAGFGGDQFSFDGLDFEWNPEDGDLVLTLAIVPPPQAGAGGGGFRVSAPSEGGDGDQLPQGGPDILPDIGPGDNGAPDPGLGPTAAVPEPASWALMIAGFGLAGATLRQRRRLSV